MGATAALDERHLAARLGFASCGFSGARRSISTMMLAAAAAAAAKRKKHP